MGGRHLRKGPPPPRRKAPPKIPPRLAGGPKGILFVHSNFPGQFGDMAAVFRDRGERVAAIGAHTAPGVDGVPMAKWQSQRGSTKEIFRAATRAEADLIRARAALDAAQKLKDQGFYPDLIIGHPGWGETLYLRLIWPQAKIILFGEYYYHAEGSDIDFDRELDPPDFEKGLVGYSKNATMGMAYSEADAIVCPTPYQAATLPKNVQHVIRLIHEGVDTDKAAPKPDATFTLPDGRVLDRSKPVITHVNRHMEPMRGIHPFLRSLPKALQAVPEAEVIVIGNAGAGGYGAKAPDGGSWRDYFLKELGPKLDMSRVHFVGRTSHEAMLNALQISWAHVYYTYPFVLSWSLLEAMACECLVLASDTAPVHDAIVNGETGVLHDFFDPAALSKSIIEACRAPEKFIEMRKAARRHVVEHFDRARIGRPQWLELIEEIRSGAKAGPAPGT
jgi:glycosyltransferase involved in cell wall biosynthesis